MISIEDATDTLIQELILEKEPGYGEWLFGKVTATMRRVDSGETGLCEHADAMATLKTRLDRRSARRSA